MGTEEMLSELRQLVGVESQVVSYKWAACHFHISAAAAKRLLHQFAEECKDQVQRTFLLSGWSKGNTQHMYQVVDEQQLEDAQGQLESVTCLHVHSVAPRGPVDSLMLWQREHQQAHDQLTKAGDTGSSSLACGMVSYQPPAPKPSAAPARPPLVQVNEEPRLAPTAEGVAAKAAPSPTKPKAQPIIEGKPSGGKASGGKPSSGQLGTSAVPAKPAAAKPQSKETGKPPSGKAAGGSVANMWSKAAAQPKSGAAAAAGPVLASQGSDKVAEASQQQSSQNGGSQPQQSNVGEEDEEEEAVAGHKKSRGKRTRAMVMLEDSDDDERAAGSPAKKAAVQQGAKHKASLAQDPAAEALDMAEDDEVPAAQPQQPAQQSKVPAAAAVPPAKAQAAAPSAAAAPGGTRTVRKRVMKTVINDKGEEVTQEVEEVMEVDASQEAAAAPPPLPQKSSPAAKPAPKGAPAPAAKQKGKQPAGKAAGTQKSIATFFQKRTA